MTKSKHFKRLMLSIFNGSAYRLKTLLLAGCASASLFSSLFADFTGPVRTKSEFLQAISLAEPGAVIEISNGNYQNWRVEIDCEGTSDRPIRIRAQTKHQVVFSGINHFRISGRYIEISGILFENCNFQSNLLEFRKSENCILTECIIRNSGGDSAAVSIKPGARNNLITKCEFINLAARCINLTVNEDIHSSGIPTNNVIRENVFRDIPAKGENGRETIKIGQNQPENGHVRTLTLVENNTFIRCDGEGEIISNKSAGNIYRQNQFFDCEGELVMRGGRDCLIEGNKLFNCRGGIRLSGTGHTVKNNWIINSRTTGIRLLYGMTAEQGGHYQAPSGCLIKHNTIVNSAEAGIRMGDGRNKDWGAEKGIQSIAPYNNTFAENIISGTQGELIVQLFSPQNEINRNWFHLDGNAKATNPGKNPFYGDPLFRDVSAQDYRLSSDSPVRKVLSIADSEF